MNSNLPPGVTDAMTPGNEPGINPGPSARDVRELKKGDERDKPYEPYRQSWMSDDQYECAKMLACLMGGFHHLKQKDITRAGFGIEWRTFRDFATFDGALLTRAVLLAHANRIRFEISSGSDPDEYHKISIMLHKRQDSGAMHERHPGLDDLIQMAESYK